MYWSRTCISCLLTLDYPYYFIWRVIMISSLDSYRKNYGSKWVWRFDDDHFLCGFLDLMSLHRFHDSTSKLQNFKSLFSFFNRSFTLTDQHTTENNCQEIYLLIFYIETFDLLHLTWTIPSFLKEINLWEQQQFLINLDKNVQASFIIMYLKISIAGFRSFDSFVDPIPKLYK